MSNYRTNDADRVASLCKALSSPHRVRILAALIEACGASCETDDGCSSCVGDLAAGLGLSPSTVSHHVKELRLAGLLRCERKGQRVECSLDTESLAALHGFTFHLVEQAGVETSCACQERTS